MKIVLDLQLTEANRPVLEWFRQEGWLHAVELPANRGSAVANSVRADGWEVILTLHAHPDTLSRQCYEKGLSIPDVPALISEHLAGSSCGSESQVWIIFLEEDSAGVALPQQVLREKPKTHIEAKRMLDNRLNQGIAEMRKHGASRFWGVCGFASSTHSFAASGLDCIIIERANDDVDDLQTGVAFCRGAARQLGCQWGIDLSLWWGPIYGCVADLPTSFHKRHLYVSYFSGADAMRLEGGDMFVDLSSGKPTAIGDETARFAAFCKTHDRGEPDVPVAVMLPCDHGWTTPAYWKQPGEAWNYARIPYRPGERGIDGFFQAAFPGSEYASDPFPFGSYTNDVPPASPFSLSCVTPKYAPSSEDVFSASPPVPFSQFSDRIEAGESLRQSGQDPSIYRPMGNSRWGDIFDVVTTDVSPSVLSSYRLLIIVGPVACDSSLKEKLAGYVTAGGRLLIAAGVASPGDEDLVGMKIEPELRTGRAWQWEGEAPVAESFRYVHSPRNCDSVTILAKTCGGDPLVTRKIHGAGCVYYGALPWLESGGAPLSRLALRLLDQAIGSVQPVSVQGLPVEWLSASGPGNRTVVIANNGSEYWSGRLSIRDSNRRVRSCQELLSERPLDIERTHDGIIVGLDIAPFDLGIVGCFE